MKLMIVESPGKIAKLKPILGAGWDVATSVGHIRDLPLKGVGVEAPDFKPKYELTERGKEVVAKLKAKVERADVVYLATDPDREGESISWHLQQVLKLKNPKRVTFNEVTPKTVQAALENPRTIDGKLVGAQEARRVLDRLVGYLVSPKLSDLAMSTLSAGRVQSVAVRLVVERDEEIEAFKPVDHFGVELIFAEAKTGEKWTAQWDTKQGFATEEAPYVLDQQLAEQVASLKNLTVLDCKEGEAQRNPPPPFITSTLQQAGSVTLRLDPKATMEVAQKLFEGGHITYHRTDNPNISAESLPDLARAASAYGLKPIGKQRMFKISDDAQAGHPAITPSHWEIEEAGDTPEQQALYKLIRLRAIACQLPAARYAVRTVVLQGQQDDIAGGQPVIFTAKGRKLTDAGWLQLVARDEAEEESEDQDADSSNPIPALQTGDPIQASAGELQRKRTKAPPRYTMATLVQKLEREGIGRPATYAAITDNIESREYVKQTGRFIASTETGRLVVNALRGKFDFMQLDFTRQVEKELDRIANGAEKYTPVVTRFHARLQQELQAIINEIPTHPCPACGSDMRRMKGAHGYFWGCTSYPDCKEIRPDDGGKPGAKGPTAQLSSEFHCEECGKPLVHRSKKGKGAFDFWGCSGYREGCKAIYENKGGRPVFKKGGPA